MTTTARPRAEVEANIQEAVHYSKMSTGWSVYLNGMQTDDDQFADELNQIGQHLPDTA